MAESLISPNNASVRFTSMPMESEAQRRLMWWAKNNPEEAKKRGIKPSVAKDFTEADQGGKLPARKRHHHRSPSHMAHTLMTIRDRHD